MGSRNKERREPRKPKKGEKKAPVLGEAIYTPEVEVVRKKKKSEEEQED